MSATPLMPIVQKLEGRSDRKRGQFICDYLDTKKIAYDLHRYRELMLPTYNVVVTKPGQTPYEILILSHYDVYHGLYDAYHSNPGANDNASSVAVALDVIERLTEANTYCTIKALFFDDEEMRLLRPIPCFGSSRYVKKYGIDHTVGVFCLEMCGMGDSVAVWPVTAAEQQTSLLIAAIKRTVTAHQDHPLGCLPPMTGFASDYLPFRRAGVKEAFCLSAFPNQDRPRLLQLFTASIPTLAVQFSIPKMLRITGHIPPLLRYYHSRHDCSAHLSESALRMTANTLHDAILDYDQRIQYNLADTKTL
jgi:hypothetical protein